MGDKRFAHPLESILAGAREANMELMGVDAETRQKYELLQAKSEEDARAIASAWARFYESPDGRKALELLFDVTLRRTQFAVHQGASVESVALWGSFREGQNALAHEIARQIALGRGDDEPPKPRETGS